MKIGDRVSPFGVLETIKGTVRDVNRDPWDPTVTVEWDDGEWLDVEPWDVKVVE